MGEMLKGGKALLKAWETAVEARGGHFCLLIDQFEELFRLTGWSAPAEAKLFIDILNCAGESDNGAPSVSIVLTMRSDYLGACARHDGFAETVNRCQYLLPKMNDFGLLLAIHEPAKLFGGEVSEDAAEALMAGTVSEADRLPILQHALMRAWDYKSRPEKGWRLELDDLKAIGGVEAALSRHADEVLGDAIRGPDGAPAPAREEALEWIFRSLTDLDADGLGVRRTRRFRELIQVAGSQVDEATVRALVDRFRAADCSFLAPYQPEPIEAESGIEISHEALIRKWGRLSDRRWEAGRPRGWVWREFQDGQTWRALAFLAQGRGSTLSPAATEQRLPWFRMIQKRPEWTQRYAAARASVGGTDNSEANGELADVKSLFERSVRNLRWERLRRLWLPAGVASAFLLVATQFSLYFNCKRNRKNTKRYRIKAELFRQKLAL